MQPMERKDGFVEVSYKTGRAYFTSNVEHTHQGIELYYLVSGTKIFYVNGNTYTLKAGDVMLIPSMLPHRSQWGKEALPSRIVTLFSNDFVLPAIEYSGSTNIASLLSDEEKLLSLSAAGRSQFEILLRSLNDELTQVKEEGMCLVRMYLLQLFICLIRNGTRANSPRKKKSSCYIQAIANYIDENYDSPLTLESLAALFYMNPSAMSRSFKSVIGLTVVGYINQKRIERAKDLLEAGKLSVATISEKLGYNDPSYFERVFKRNTNLTPTEYKKRLISC